MVFVAGAFVCGATFYRESVSLMMLGFVMGACVRLLGRLGCTSLGFDCSYRTLQILVVNGFWGVGFGRGFVLKGLGDSLQIKFVSYKKYYFI